MTSVVVYDLFVFERGMKKSTSIFLVISACLLLSGMGFVYFNNNVIERDFNTRLVEQSQNRKSAWKLALHQTYLKLSLVATFVANDPKVQTLFLQGKKAVLEEGGKKGGKQAALIRQRLYELVGPGWSRVQKKFFARQLHFHLGPGSTSFLRVHRFKKFGDKMDDVRFIIVDTNREKTGRVGFETGRIYSGLRAVSPVFARDSSSRRRVHVGALEVGGSFYPLIKSFAESQKLDAGVFLWRKHVQSVMWKDSMVSRFGKKDKYCGCAIETSTNKNMGSIIKAASSQKISFRQQGTYVLRRGERVFALTVLPLRDYKGRSEPKRANVGGILFWQDITNKHVAMLYAKKFNLFYGFLGFLFLELLLFLAFNYVVLQLETEIEKQTSLLRKSEKRSLKAEKMAHLGHWEWDLLKNRLWWSEETYRIFEVDKDSFQPSLKTLLQRIHPDEQQKFKGSMREALQQNEVSEYSLEYRVLTGREEEKYVHILGEIIVNEEGVPIRVVGTIHDITERHQYEEELLLLSSTDSLTGALNRRAFFEQAPALFSLQNRQEGTLSFLMIDADHFKKINDDYGHDVGDDVLRRLSHMILHNKREEDLFVRLGGEEFGLLLPGANAKGAKAIARRIVHDVRALRVRISDHDDVKVTVSIGISQFSEHCNSLDAILKIADENLYRAKETGRDRYYDDGRCSGLPSSSRDFGTPA